MKQFFCLYILAMLSGSGAAQNNARLFCADGCLFKVYVNDRAVNKTAQASVLLEKITKDTLYIKVEFENNSKYGATLYLLEKGERTTNREFNYTIGLNKNKLSVDFTGAYAVVPLPDPIVPKKIQVDTSAKYRNIVLGHFCEIKNEKPVYFNNLPKAAGCTEAMPAEYLDYTRILMQKTNTPDDRYAIVENVCRNNCLNASQLSTLLEYIAFDLDKLKLIRFTYPNLVDPQNQKTLEKNFKTDASLSELDRFLKNAAEYKTRSGNACVKASPEEEINKFTEEWNLFTSDVQRLQAFKKTYANHCYSSVQAVSILQKFMHDRERLEAAKLLYFNCVDKENFLAVSGTFTYPQSVEELKDFVEKQQK